MYPLLDCFFRDTATLNVLVFITFVFDEAIFIHKCVTVVIFHIIIISKIHDLAMKLNMHGPHRSGLFYYFKFSFSRTNASMTGLFSLRGIFNFPWHRHQTEGTDRLLCLFRKTQAKWNEKYRNAKIG